MLKKQHLLTGPASILILVLLLVLPALAVPPETDVPKGIDPVVNKISIGMNPSQVRTALGMPQSISKDTWRYATFFVIFERRKVACIISNKCYGHWRNCKAYKQRSKDCYIK